MTRAVPQRFTPVERAVKQHRTKETHRSPCPTAALNNKHSSGEHLDCPHSQRRVEGQEIHGRKEGDARIRQVNKESDIHKDANNDIVKAVNGKCHKLSDELQCKDVQRMLLVPDNRQQESYMMDDGRNTNAADIPTIAPRGYHSLNEPNGNNGACKDFSHKRQVVRRRRSNRNDGRRAAFHDGNPAKWNC